MLTHCGNAPTPWAERLPDELRLGLSYEEFLITRRDFRALWATPIQHVRTHEQLGVVSLNLDRHVEARYEPLNETVRPALREFAHITSVLALGG